MITSGDTQTGNQLTACSPAGLPVRPIPLSLSLNPVDNAEGDAERTSTPSISASAELAAALGSRSTREQDEIEDMEPVEARVPRKAPSPEDPTEAEIESHKLSGHACFRSWCRHCV